MATLKHSKQLRVKSLDQDILDQITVIQGNVEAFKNTGIPYFLMCAEARIQDVMDEVF